jgi:hypothetical protein
MGSRDFTYPDVNSSVTKSEFCSPSDCWNFSAPSGGVCQRKYGIYRGVDTPHFAKRKKRGELLPLNAYIRQDVDYGGLASTSIDFTCPAGCHGSMAYGNLPWLYIPTSYISAPEDLQLEMSTHVNTTALLQEAVADCAPDLDALTTLMEAHKTVSMVLDARSNAKRLIRQAMRGGIRGAAKALGSAWLEWRYGWRNLGFDIQDCAKAFNTPRRLFVSGRSGMNGPSGTFIESGTFWYDGTAVILHWASEVSVDTSYRANAIGRYVTASVNQLYSPSITLWEEIPFSWVADWFVTAGAAIAAWVVLSSLQQVYCSLGYKSRVSAEARITSADPSSGYCTYTNPRGSGSAHYESTTLARWPVGVPSLVPQFRVRLDSKRLADAAAILATRIL